jgi:hypothetical protein
MAALLEGAALRLCSPVATISREIRPDARPLEGKAARFRLRLLTPAVTIP